MNESSSTMNGSNGRAKPPEKLVSGTSTSKYLVPTGLLLASLALFAWIGRIAEGETVEQVEGRSGLKKNRGSGPADLVCVDRCSKRKEDYLNKFGNSLLDRNDLHKVWRAQFDSFLDKMKADYGEYFEPMFVDAEASKAANRTRFNAYIPASPDGGSMNRLKRKLMVKALSVQKQVLKVESDVGGCDCTDGAGKALSNNVEALHESESAPAVDPFYDTYVWSNGGHSASAGHGNLYNESYTAVLERDVKEAFAVIGLNFEGRNYAMGGTGGGPEVSSCWEQIFGQDVDFFTWDYGMTDGRREAKFAHYAVRGHLSPGRPPILIIKGGRKRQAAAADLEFSGLTAFAGLDEVYTHTFDAAPDSAGLSDEEINKLPSGVRNLKCRGSVELGLPYCKESKYSSLICPGRLKQAKWHPGVKVHAIDGHTLALFLFQAFDDALKDLADHENKDPVALLAELERQEVDLHEQFKANTSLPLFGDELYYAGRRERENRYQEYVAEIPRLFKGKSICRTGRLPAKSRYLGYTTNTDKVGDIAVLGKEEFDTGIALDEARKPNAINETMPLVYEPGDKERKPCEVIVKPDYKDFFYLNQVHGKGKIVFPNEKEKAAYKYDPSDFAGIIHFFPVLCDWGKCKRGDLQLKDYDEGKWEMTINGKKVTSFIDGQLGHFVAKGEQGIHWEPNENGDYVLEFEIKEDGGYLRISSIALF